MRCITRSGPACRIRFVFALVTLAVLFAPVRFYFGPTRLIAPCCYVLYELGLYSQRSLLSPLTGALLCYLLLYLISFSGIAFLSYEGSLRLAARQQHLIRGLAVLAIACSSFLRVINFADLGWPTGTYNFWEACFRYAKTEGKRHTGLP